MKHSADRILLALLLAFFLTASAGLQVHAAPPNLINYQGHLTDSGGSPVTNGDYPMTLRIFDTATVGTPLYEETQTVTVAAGIYDVLLGSGTVVTGSFDSSLFAGDPRWLEVQIGSEVLTPRQRITSVAWSLQTHEAVHAVQCQTADSANTVADGAITDAALAPGSITLAKLGINCAPGEVLMQVSGTWQCTTTPKRLHCTPDQIIKWNGIDWQCASAGQCSPGDFVNCYSGPTGTMGVGSCKAGVRTCDTQGQFGACIGEVLPTVEVCDSIDNDCDGSADEGLNTDGDGDGHYPLNACGGLAPADDCDDGDNTIYPGATELPYSGIDENCDGSDTPVTAVPPFDNMFAAKACNADPTGPNGSLRNTYCGGAAGGTPADFDRTAFKALYQNLNDTTIYPDHTGSYVRTPVPMCEDGSDIDVIGGATTCPDGKPPIQCTDGTRPVFFLRTPIAPSSPHAKDWIVRVQGGDDTCGTHPLETNCYAFQDADFSSRYVGSGRDINGVFRSGGPFADWGAVFMDKCVGDRNMGDNRVDDYQYYKNPGGLLPDSNGQLSTLYNQTISNNAGTGPVYFHGKRILRATISWLVDHNHLAQGSHLLMTANSNGSNGLYQYLDEIAHYADTRSGTDIDVRGIPTSYVRSSIQTENFLNTGSWGNFNPQLPINAPQSTAAGLGTPNGYNGHYNYNTFKSNAIDRGAGEVTVMTNDPYVAGGLNAQRYADWGAVPDATCSADASVPWACLDSMNVLMGHIQTPVFVMVQTGDKVMRLAHHFFGNVAYGVVYHPNDFEDRVRATVRRLDDLNEGHGAFVTTTDDHKSLADDAKALRRVGNIALEQALFNWATSPPGTESFCVAEQRTGPQSWYHYLLDPNTHNSLEPPGAYCVPADSSFTCPGAQPCNPAGVLPPW